MRQDWTVAPTTSGREQDGSTACSLGGTDGSRCRTRQHRGSLKSTTLGSIPRGLLLHRTDQVTLVRPLVRGRCKNK